MTAIFYANLYGEGTQTETLDIMHGPGYELLAVVAVAPGYRAGDLEPVGAVTLSEGRDATIYMPAGVPVKPSALLALPLELRRIRIAEPTINQIVTVIALALAERLIGAIPDDELVSELQVSVMDL